MPQKGYKYRLYPEPDQQQQLNKIFGSIRHVWNHCLDQSIIAYETYKANSDLLTKPVVSGYVFCNWLINYKNNNSWLKEISDVALQQKMLDLGNAFQLFFGKNNKTKTGYPKFKKKGHYESFRLTNNGFRFKDGKLFIAKITTPLNIRWSRDLPSKPSSCTISKTPSCEYYISFICEHYPQPTNGLGIIGIDLGLTNLATISNGEVIQNPRHFAKAQCRLARLQCRLSKVQKGSKNYEKSRIKIARCHQRITNCRNDYLHKLSTRLVRENQAIGIEDLKVGNMVHNHCLAKHIMDASWNTFRKQLEYKASDSQHCRIIVADNWYPSTQLCSCCGLKPKIKIKFGIKEWVCEKCGSCNHRDFNASLNLEKVAKDGLQLALINNQTTSIILMPAYI